MYNGVHEPQTVPFELMREVELSASLATHPMKRRSSAIFLLVIVNLGLLAALLSECFELPPAYAQPGGRGADYLCVTAKPAGQSYDVLYLLDPSAHRLHAMYPSSPPAKKLTRTEPRDLKKDFDK